METITVDKFGRVLVERAGGADPITGRPTGTRWEFDSIEKFNAQSAQFADALADPSNVDAAKIIEAAGG